MAYYRDAAFRITGALRIDTLHAVSLNLINGCMNYYLSLFTKLWLCSACSCVICSLNAPACFDFLSSWSLKSWNWWPVHQWSSPPPAPCFYMKRGLSDMWVGNNQCSKLLLSSSGFYSYHVPGSRDQLLKFISVDFKYSNSVSYVMLPFMEN